MQVVSLNHHTSTINSPLPQTPVAQGAASNTQPSHPTQTSQIIPVIPVTFTPSDLQNPPQVGGTGFYTHQSSQQLRKSNSATG